MYSVGVHELLEGYNLRVNWLTSNVNKFDTSWMFPLIQKLQLIFFFSCAHGHGPGSVMVSAMAERLSRYLTEPECNGSAEQRLKEGTPVHQNRPGIEPGPPEALPAQRGT